MKNRLLIAILSVFLLLGNALPVSSDTNTFTGGLKYAAGSSLMTGDFYRKVPGMLNISSKTFEGMPIAKRDDKYGNSKKDFMEPDKIDWLARGIAFENQGRLHEALEAFSKAVAVKGSESSAYLHRAKISGMLGRCGQAVEDYSIVIEKTPRNALAYTGRGAAYECLGKGEDAVKDYSKAAEITPHDAEVFYSRAVAHAALHRYEQAVSDFSKSISINPNRAIVYFKRGKAYGMLNQHGRAVTDYNKAIEMNLELPTVFISRGDALRNLGNYDKALGDYEEAARLHHGTKDLRKKIEDTRVALLKSRPAYPEIRASSKASGKALSRRVEDNDNKTERIERPDPDSTTHAVWNVSHPGYNGRHRESQAVQEPEQSGFYFAHLQDLTSDVIPVNYSYGDEAYGMQQTDPAPYLKSSEDNYGDTISDIHKNGHEDNSLLSQNLKQEVLPAAENSEHNTSSPAAERGNFKEPAERGDRVTDNNENTKDKQKTDEPVAAEAASDAKGLVIGDLYQGSKVTVTFKGVVIDPYAKPLVGARIELINMPRVTTVSGAGGAFSLDGVPEGDKFLIKIEMDGFLESYISGFQYPAAAKGPYWITMYRVPGSVPPDKTQKKPVNIEADSMSYERDKDTYHARGNVIITHEADPGGVMTSNEASLNHANNEAESSGNVVVRSGKDVIYGDRMVMDTETKKGKVYNGRMFMSKNHFYIKGDKIEKTGEASYFVENATATTCDGESPDWRIRSSELDITIDGYGTAKHGRFEAKGVPVAYSPYFVFPVKTTRQSGLLFPYMSYSRDKLGWDVEIPFYWAISKSMDATFYQRYMSQRGFKEGAEFRYAMSPNHYGTFYADFLKDSKQISEKTGNISRNWNNDQKRWSLYLNHISNFSPTFYLRSDIAKVSDNWYFKDFSSHNYYLSNYSKTDENKFRKIAFVGDETINSLDSTVRLVKNWELYNLTGLVRYTDDFTQQYNDATLQKYPEITLTGIKQPLFKTPVNYELTSLYSYNYRVEGQRGQLFDIKPDFTLPINLGRYAQLTPRLGWRGTVWERDDKQEDLGNRRGTRQMFNMGAVLNTEIQRIFNVGIGNVEKIRHSVKPELTYNYIPYVAQGDIPNYVTPVYEQDALTYALTNTLTARLKDKGGKVSYREIMRLKLAQLYDFKEARRSPLPGERDNRPFSFVDIELDVNPFQYLAFSARNKYSVNSGEWRQQNYDMTLSDWRGDMINIGYRYTYNKSWGLPDLYSIQGLYPREQYTQDPGSSDPLKEITLSLKAVITDNWEATYFQRRNENISTDTERTFGLNYRRQCWSIKVSYTDKKSLDAYGVEQPDRVFMVLISFYGLGGIGTM